MVIEFKSVIDDCLLIECCINRFVNLFYCSWAETPGRKTGAETPGATPSTRQWDATPGHATPGATTPGRETPGQAATPSARKNRWDETPKTERGILNEYLTT